MTDLRKTGLVLNYRFLWSYEQQKGADNGRKARPICVVVPLNVAHDVVVLFPLTTQEPAQDRVALRVPDIERRRLTLKGKGPSWIILDEGNRDEFPSSPHVEPISYDPPVAVYGEFSKAFMDAVIKTLAQVIRSGNLKLIRRD
jgi:hypothetical protein